MIFNTDVFHSLLQFVLITYWKILTTAIYFNIFVLHITNYVIKTIGPIISADS